MFLGGPIVYHMMINLSFPLWTNIIGIWIYFCYSKRLKHIRTVWQTMQIVCFINRCLAGKMFYLAWIVTFEAFLLGTAMGIQWVRYYSTFLYTRVCKKMSVLEPIPSWVTTLVLFPIPYRYISTHTRTHYSIGT